MDVRFIVKRDLHMTESSGSSSPSTLSYDVFMEERRNATIETVVSLLQQVDTLLQQAVSAIRELGK